MADIPDLPGGFKLDQPPPPPGFKIDAPEPPVNTNAVALGGADMDEYFSAGTPGYLLDKFGQGAKDGWGAKPLGLDPETDAWLKKYAPDYGLVGRAFHDAVVRPAAAALDFALNRLPNALYHGVGDIAVDVGVPRDIVAFPEAFPAGHLTGFPAAVPVPAEIERAADLGVIGKGEAGYQDLATAEAVKALSPTGKPTATEAVARPVSPETPAPATAAPVEPDLHSIARDIAPDTFSEYDTLSAQKDALFAELTRQRELRAAGSSPEVAAIDARIEAAERAGLTTNKLQIERARAVKAVQPGTEPTPEMTALQQRMMEIDYQRRDLAPDVSAAYRKAAEGVPQEAAAEPVQPPEAAAAPETLAPAAAEPSPAAPEPAPQPATAAEPIPGGISGDVAKQLVAAGRPAEEADAAAALVQAHYEARAERFDGAKGTAEDLYRADAPAVRAGRGVKPAEAEAEPALEPAQGTSTRRGKIRLATDDAKATITLFKDADASTFIHETGHHWLEELMSDATDARAPADLTNDAATVRNWLGVEDGAEIPTRGHEKFARGFERYMMEGHAPSAKLADVFGKFRDWLTKIYETVAGLRSPINDDIRGVFDRMLATKGEEPVIAPERPTGTFADIHEADAELTPPPEASETAALVRSERDKIGEAAHPEIQDERIGARAPAEDAGSAGGGGVSGQGEPARGDNAGPAGRVSKPGAVGEGGGKAAAEGNRASERQRNPNPGTEQPTGPHAEFGPADDGLVDKAGNIRLDKINAPDDVKALIKQVAEENQGFDAARRGVVSDQQVIDTAAAMGLRPEDLDIGRLRAEFTAEKIEAVRNLFVQSSNDAHRLSIAAAAGADADVLAYMQARSRLRMVQEYLSAITAESGRGQRAFRRVIPGMDRARDLSQIMGDLAEGRTLNQIREEAARVARLDTPAKVSGYLREVDKPGLGAMALELFQNWLISGPLTHMGYGVGNYLLALHKAVPETAFAATADVIRSGVTGTPRTVYYGEIGAQLYGMVRGQRNGFKAAWDSFKAGQTMPLPGEAAPGLPGVGARPTTPFTRQTAIPDFEVGGIPVPLGSVVRVPGERMVAPIHSYFRSIGYEQAIGKFAYRQATSEGLTEGAFERRVADLTAHPTTEMMAAARDEATQQTLMGRGGSLTQRISQFVNWEAKVPLLGPTRLLRFIDPFVHIQSNVLEQGVFLRGALGALQASIRDDLAGKNGALAQSTAIGRLSAGTALSAVAIGLAAESLLTPSAPSDPKEGAVWRMIYGQPHALNIGGMSYDMSRLGVLGFQLGIAADLYHFGDSIGKEDVTKLSALLVHSFTQNFLDEGFMRGPSDLIKALDEPDRYGQRYVQNFAASLAVPFSVGMGQIAGQIDPYARQARTLLDQIKAKIPFLSETLMPRRDLWGQPIPAREWEGVYAKRLQDDPVNRKLMELTYFPAQPQRKIRGVELTEQQYDDYSRIGGKLAKMQLDAIVNPAFGMLPPETQIKLIKETVTHSRELAAEQIMMQSVGSANDIIRQASDAKSAALHGAKPVEVKEMLKAH